MNKVREMVLKDRIKIQVMYSQKHSYSEIAKELGFDKSTICREIKKGMVGQQKDYKDYMIYDAEYSQNKTKDNISKRGALSKLKINCKFLLWATDKITKDKYSPNALVMEAQRDKLFTKDEMVCAWTIYKYINFHMIPNVSSKDLHCPRKKKDHYVRK